MVLKCSGLCLKGVFMMEVLMINGHAHYHMHYHAPAHSGYDHDNGNGD